MTDAKGWGCPTCGDKNEVPMGFCHYCEGDFDTHSADECPMRTMVPCPTCAAKDRAVEEAVREEREAIAREFDPDKTQGWMPGEFKNSICEQVATFIRARGGGADEPKGGQHGHGNV